MNKKLLVSILAGVMVSGNLGPPVAFAQAEKQLKPEKQYAAEEERYTRQISSAEQQLNEAFESARKADAESKAALALQPVVQTERVFSPTFVDKGILPVGKREKLITLDFENAVLQDVLKTIATAADVNFSLDPALRDKKVDFQVKDVTLEDTMRLLYSTYGLSSTLIGNSLYISVKEKIKQDTMETRLIKLQNLNVDEAKVLIQGMVEVMNVSKEINALIVMGSAEEIGKVEQILKRADQPQPLVVLETNIVEVNRDSLRQLGVNWSQSITANFQESNLPATLANVATAANGDPFKIYRISRNALQFQAALNVLENQNKAKVLANPRVTTLNNKTSQIFVGDQIPYTVTLISGGATTTEVRWVEPGIRLKITPSIIDQDFVVIKIEPEVSFIYTFKGPNQEYPWIKTREATAYVRVKAGDTFVLGGLLTSDYKKNTYKVPFIGDAPLIGGLFRYDSSSFTDSELIITVTPMIIMGTEK